MRVVGEQEGDPCLEFQERESFKHHLVTKSLENLLLFLIIGESLQNEMASLIL